MCGMYKLCMLFGTQMLDVCCSVVNVTSGANMETMDSSFKVEVLHNLLHFENYFCRK